MNKVTSIVTLPALELILIFRSQFLADATTALVHPLYAYRTLYGVGICKLYADHMQNSHDQTNQYMKILKSTSTNKVVASFFCRPTGLNGLSMKKSQNLLQTTPHTRQTIQNGCHNDHKKQHLFIKYKNTFVWVKFSDKVSVRNLCTWSNWIQYWYTIHNWKQIHFTGCTKN